MVAGRLSNLVEVEYKVRPSVFIEALSGLADFVVALSGLKEVFVTLMALSRGALSGRALSGKSDLNVALLKGLANFSPG